MSKSFEDDVAFQAKQNLVVTEVGILGQVENWLLLLLLVILVIVNFYKSLANEVHLLHITLVANHNLARSLNTAEHLDNQFVCESSFAFFEEMVEASFKFLENSSVLNEICLHLGSDLLVELEFFDH